MKHYMNLVKSTIHETAESKISTGELVLITYGTKPINDTSFAFIKIHDQKGELRYSMQMPLSVYKLAENMIIQNILDLVERT